MKVIIMISPKITNTAVTISFINKLSNRMCIKYEITVLTFMLAIMRAAATEKAPR